MIAYYYCDHCGNDFEDSDDECTECPKCGDHDVNLDCLCTEESDCHCEVCEDAKDYAYFANETKHGR